MDRQTVEWAAFQLKKDVSEQALLQASGELQQNFLQKQPGFIRRELLKKSEGSYVDILWWKTRKYAEQASDKVMQHPACLGYFQLMDADLLNPSEALTYFLQVKTYP